MMKDPAEPDTGQEGAHEGAPTAAQMSIYDLYSPRRRNMIIFTAALGFLLSFCTSIYFPALKMVQEGLHTREELVAATVGIYLATFGVASLVWGPASDRFGRMPIYGTACAGFVGTSLGCVFAPNISTLLALRALQGAAGGAFMVTALAVVADVVHPQARGRATGITSMAVALGTVASPLVGGGLSKALGWRSTFAALAVLCFLFALALLLVMRQETHQRFVLLKLARCDPDKAAHITEWNTVMDVPLKFHAPWIPLRYLFEPCLMPHAAVGIVMWGVLMCIVCEILPATLADAPYNLSPELVGVALLVDAVPTIIATPLGGWLSDRFAVGASGIGPAPPVARLVPSTLGVLVLGPAGVLGTGWALHYSAHIGLVLTASAVACFGCYFYLPGLFSYVTTIKQSVAGSATAGVQSIMTFTSGLSVAFGTVARKAMGMGPWLTLLSMLQLLITAVAFVIIVREQRAYKRALLQLPRPAASLEDGGVDAADAQMMV